MKGLQVYVRSPLLVSIAFYRYYSSRTMVISSSPWMLTLTRVNIGQRRKLYYTPRP